MGVSETDEAARRREIAAQAVDPCVTSSAVVAAFWDETGGAAIDPQAGYEAVLEQVQAARDGGLAGAETMLMGQAIALNAIFAEMARRGQAALGRPGIAAERYIRLAVRAQAQCRATVRALSDMANRPSSETEPPRQITRIERIIVTAREPGAARDMDLGDDGPGDDWAARNMMREAYGEGLDA
ncbi:hypothetical protein [Sphingomonas crusticola]|uniref:hypothetical protein n=1 Tax=Sphingomonas crusticola TaxID=1697973 RepID=UPI000E25E04C|nr:hypothetical protein [Sphingomonas crusticola]